MSGRSAYVRKQVKKSDDTELPNSEPRAIQDVADTFSNLLRQKPSRTRSSFSSDEYAYARVRSPNVPDFTVVGSGITKSPAREKIDQMSENIRKGLLGFGKKKPVARETQDSTEIGSPSAFSDGVANTIAQEVSNYIQDEGLPASPTTTISTTVTTNTFGVGGQDALHRAFPPTQVDIPRKSSPDALSNQAATSPPPQRQLPAIPPVIKMKRWKGFGQAAHGWNKLRRDPELWDPLGDTLIYLTRRSHNTPALHPSFRVSSRVLKCMDSAYFSDLLDEGQVDERRYSRKRSSGMTSRSTSPTSAHDLSLRKQRDELQLLHSLSFPTPPQSISTTSSTEVDEMVIYELFFPCPPELNKTDALYYHATTRNVFAMLYQVSIVGPNLSQALADLVDRLRVYLPSLDCSSLVKDYVIAKGLDDVRNDPSAAISLLHWSENKKTRWQAGWWEAFVHCVGMFDRIETLSEWQDISPVTRALVERANLECQVEVNDAEERLASFDFDSIWSPSSEDTDTGRGCYDRLRLLFVGFYTSERGMWPPLRIQDGPWLTRELLATLRTDFGALYEYLVDRQAISDVPQLSTSLHQDHKSISDKSDLILEPCSMADILKSFDERNNYPTIPHPYPLLPISIPSNTGTSDRLHARKVGLAYSDSTNVYLLGDSMTNKLVDAYIRFEKIDQVTVVDPHIARQSRWILIYAILQTLASVNVDAPGLKWKEGVSYHLNAKSRRNPPWSSVDTPVFGSSHTQSYCWHAPKKWVRDSNMKGYDVSSEDSI